VSFESLDGSFRCIGSVDIGWHELVSCVPSLGDGSAVVGTGFVVEYLVLDFVAFGVEASHDAPVCGYPMAVVAGLEGFHENGVGVAVVGQHDVLVATARACGESAHVVCVELADGFYGYMEFV
jgi:hypothetical protein